MAVGRVLGSSYGDVIVGRDPRLTGEMLASALIAGVLASGADATDAGMVSTPTLAGAAGPAAGRGGRRRPPPPATRRRSSPRWAAQTGRSSWTAGPAQRPRSRRSSCGRWGAG